MLFNSIHFLFFFPIVVLAYFIIPQKFRYLWLLLASYYFYMSWNPKYMLLIAASTVVTWGSGLLIAGCAGKPVGKAFPISKKWCMAGCFGFNLGILFFFKYYGFASANVKALLRWGGVETLGMPVFFVFFPVGISFYTFQALGYVTDVYRKEILPEKNLLRYALFISFFPQLVAGPIERSKNLMQQMKEPHYFDPDRVKDGLLLMGWGFFEKLVIADRIAILVTDVYSHYTDYTGLQIGVATILFAFQIYCDFSGYSDIAIGAARIMGFNLMKNFKSPYFATTVSGFWRNWHISLTTWFRDYVYIPLGGNRCGKWKKYRNIMVTFLVSGLWHGASWNYVVWGGLNGLYQVVGDFTMPFRKKAAELLKVRTGCWSYRFFQGVVTFALVDFAWLFFRANGFMAAVRMMRHGLGKLGVSSMIDPQRLMGVNTLGMEEKDFYVMLLGLAMLMAVDHYKRKVDIKKALAKQNLAFRWLVYYGVIFTVLIFGIYGPGYDASSFIYFQF